MRLKLLVGNGPRQIDCKNLDKIELLGIVLSNIFVQRLCMTLLKAKIDFDFVLGLYIYEDWMNYHIVMKMRE